jgi:hypothetical protein
LKQHGYALGSFFWGTGQYGRHAQAADHTPRPNNMNPLADLPPGVVALFQVRSM